MVGEIFYVKSSKRYAAILPVCQADDVVLLNAVVVVNVVVTSMVVVVLGVVVYRLEIMLVSANLCRGMLLKLFMYIF